jgi:hypothetical protein
MKSIPRSCNDFSIGIFERVAGLGGAPDAGGIAAAERCQRMLWKVRPFGNS